MAGVRGLMGTANGRIVDYPVKANFRTGLTPLDYFTSANGARKGRADQALRTAGAGYLTRRLINVAHDALITSEDCAVEDTNVPGMAVELPTDPRLLAVAASQLASRFLAQAVCNPQNPIETLAVPGPAALRSQMVLKWAERGVKSIAVSNSPHL